jgi:hypothetical protein
VLAVKMPPWALSKARASPFRQLAQTLPRSVSAVAVFVSHIDVAAA